MSGNMSNVTHDQAGEPLINDVDIAVAAWHEDGRWSLALLPDAQDLPQIIERLKSQQTNGGALALLAIDEAHNLAERAIDWYSVTVTEIKNDVLQLAPKKLRRAMERVNDCPKGTSCSEHTAAQPPIAVPHSASSLRGRSAATEHDAPRVMRQRRLPP
jgi:hypothetical protein